MSPSYQLKIHRKVEKQLQRIPKNHRERVVQTMRSLRENPKPSGCVKLEDSLYRVRQGQYRIIYAVFDEEIVIVICKVARRAEDTYKNLPTLLARAERVLDE
ncbi:MAG: type II toxin-antitoxin system RelE/ParE family toxin [Anaerolineales bacterium]|jgi:mRNA interferase RelE/StbE